MPATTINGVQLFWEVTGSGEPLVLVHGSWVDHHNWDAVSPSLARSFRVVSYDRRGHSQSDRSGLPGTIHDDVADLAELIAALNLGPSHVVGHSFGGSIALRLAGARPDLCRSLVVHEPPLFGLLAGDRAVQAELEAVQARVASVVALVDAGDVEGGVRQFVETIAFGPGAWAHIPPEVRETVMANAPTFVDEMHDPDAILLDLARLHRFSRPVLLTHGEESPPLFGAILEKVAQALPQARLKTFPGAGHEPEHSQPAAYVAALTQFIAGVSQPVRAG